MTNKQKVISAILLAILGFILTTFNFTELGYLFIGASFGYPLYAK